MPLSSSSHLNATYIRRVLKLKTHPTNLSSLLHTHTLDYIVVDSIPFNTRLKHQHAKHILARDRARALKLLSGKVPHGPAAAFKRRAAAQSPGQSVDVTDAAVTYTLDMGVGQPPTTYTLLIDTGSSNTWIGANKPYKPTSTSQNTHKSVTVTYGSGSFTGTEYLDQVTIGKTLKVQNQSIGVASKVQDIGDVDGILGIGPVDLTEDTVQGVTSVPTIMDNLLTQNLISAEVLGISYAPSATAGIANGELTFGGTDSSKFTGDIEYVPITQTKPSSQYWGVDQSITYGEDVVLMPMTAGIVDTGTTLLLISPNAFQAYVDATGATLDQETGLLTVTEEQFANMQSMFFKLSNGTVLEFIPNAQRWPQELNSMLGGTGDNIYLIVANMMPDDGSGQPSTPQGLDFIDGFAFLQRFYTVYDTTNKRVGFATTKDTTAEIN